MAKHKIDFVKRLAKNLKKDKGLKYSEALDKICERLGFFNWNNFIKIKKSENDRTSD